MAWVAKVKDKEKNDDGTYRFVIQIKDGPNADKQLVYSIDHPSKNMEWLKDNLRNEISNLSNLDVNITGLSKGDIISLA